jgi:hypothetical protein
MFDTMIVNLLEPTRQIRIVSHVSESYNGLTLQLPYAQTFWKRPSSIPKDETNSERRCYQ